MKILVADDHNLVIEAVKAKLGELGSSVEFVVASRVDQLLEAASDDLALALVDLAMPGSAGHRHVLELRRRFPGLPVIVLSGMEDPQIMRSLLELGVQGFIPKAYSADVMLSAVRLVLAGGVYVPPMLMEAVPAAPSGMPEGATQDLSEAALRSRLTERQVEVLRLLSSGKPNKSIARELDISEGTVKIHLAAIFRALNVRNRTEAVVMARTLTGF